MNKRLLRYDDINALYGIPRRTLFDMIKTGHFPKPTSVKCRVRFWHINDITEWENSKR